MDALSDDERASWVAALSQVQIAGTVIIGGGRSIAYVNGKPLRAGQELTVPYGGREFSYRLAVIEREGVCRWEPVLKHAQTNETVFIGL